MSRRFVSEHSGQFPVKRLCELVEVPRSSFYEWSTRPLSKRDLADIDLTDQIYEIHVASRRTYVAPTSHPASPGSSMTGAAIRARSGWPV